MFLKTLFTRTLHRQTKLLSYTPILIRSYHEGERKRNHSKYRNIAITALFSSVIIGTTLKELEADHSILHSDLRAQDVQNPKDKDKKKKNDFQAGEVDPSLPTYRLDEIGKHNTVTDMWVIFRRGVYDVTQFAQQHPGGEQIYNAAGASIEPFWNVYGAHHTEDVYRLLETYRIDWVIFRRGVYDVTQFAQQHPGGEQIYNAAGASIEPFWNVYGAHHTEDVYRLLESFRIDWVIFRRGVYNVTQFAQQHPGGEQIYNAAGASIEPFWNVYGAHHTEDVYRLLESFRIGNLHENDVVDHSDEELWAREPFRDKRLVIKTPRPFNAETPPHLQVEHFDTPNEVFFVRQHMPVPDMPPLDSHSLRVSWPGGTRSLTVEDFEKLPRAHVRAALSCAGNRRAHMNKTRPSKGIAWETGAISNAVWSGVYLRDLLIYIGVDINDTKGKHVIFQGADMDATGTKFSTSIPLWLAVQPLSCVLIADEMNGAPLPPDHGAPLRAIVPGAPAVRSVKWLEEIRISEEESSSHWHRKDYRSLSPTQTIEDIASGPAIYSLPVTSAICQPLDGDTYKVKDGRVIVRGFAYSGGGASIARVEVTTDGGKTWRSARICSDSAPHRAHYSWSLWSCSIPVCREQDTLDIWVKATDNNMNTQPEKYDDIWNVRGLLANAYHKITIKLDHSDS